VQSHVVYVLNTGDASLAGFRLGDGRLNPLSSSRGELGAGADPAQVGISPDGSKLVVTQRGTDELAIFAVGADGRLRGPHVMASSGPTPYGFAFAPDGTLIVTEAFGAQRKKAAASSYAPENGSLAPVSRSVGNGRSEICWAVVTTDGRYAFTTNFADGAVSRYALCADGSLALEDAAAGTALEGATGLRDEDVSADGRFLYAIDANSRHIFGWTIGAEGSLTPVGDWEGVPATVAGLAASSTRAVDAALLPRGILAPWTGTGGEAVSPATRMASDRSRVSGRPDRISEARRTMAPVPARFPLSPLAEAVCVCIKSPLGH
jgi:DNA-binding beta-propeller fold protein YncE